MFIHALTSVCARIPYLIFAVLVASTTFMVALWFPNRELVWSVFTDDAIAIGAKLSFGWSFVESISTNHTLLSATYTVAISFLFGVYAALLLYVVNTRRTFGGTSSGTGLLGIVAGAFGLGCAACSTLIITSLFAAFGGAALLAALPLGGSEFGIVGVILLGWSIYALTKHIDTPSLCEI